jgi:hypothetical protein
MQAKCPFVIPALEELSDERNILSVGAVVKIPGKALFGF